MTIVWSRRAIRHLVQLREHIAQANPSAAARVAERILSSVDLLVEHPNIGRPGRVAGTRELVIPDTRYIVVYRVRDPRLEIAAVFHSRRRWPKKF